MLGKAGTLGAVAIMVGCSGSDVSAGAEGEGVNLNRCFEVSCDGQGDGSVLEEPTPSVCAEGEASPITDRLAFEAVPGAEVIKVAPAPDGSVWALLRDQRLTRGALNVWLARFAGDGSLLGQSSSIETEDDSSQREYALAADARGYVTLGVYWSYAPDADSEVQERATLYGFDTELAPTQEQQFHSAANLQLVGGPAGEFWLAGNAVGNQAHGVVSRLANGVPAWVQTAVPTSGQGAGFGVHGLAVASDGTAAVLSQMAPRWDGNSANIFRWGLSTFGADGMPGWQVTLPSPFMAGASADMGGTPNGDWVVAAVAGDAASPSGGPSENGKVLVQGVSAAGHLRWAYELSSPGATYPNMEVLRSGRALLQVAQRGPGTTGLPIVVIAEDGADCQHFSLSLVGEPEAEPYSATADYIYAYNSSDHIVRVRVPE